MNRPYLSIYKIRLRSWDKSKLLFKALQSWSHLWANLCIWCGKKFQHTLRFSIKIFKRWRFFRETIFLRKNFRANKEWFMFDINLCKTCTWKDEAIFVVVVVVVVSRKHRVIAERNSSELYNFWDRWHWSRCRASGSVVQLFATLRHSPCSHRLPHWTEPHYLVLHGYASLLITNPLAWKQRCAYNSYSFF